MLRLILLAAVGISAFVLLLLLVFVSWVIESRLVLLLELTMLFVLFVLVVLFVLFLLFVLLVLFVLLA